MPLCQEKPDAASGENEVESKQQLQNSILNEIVRYVHNATNDRDMIVLNNTVSNQTSSGSGIPQGTEALNEMQMIKVIVLVVVVGILLASTCKIIFRTSSRYQTKKSEMDE